MRMIKKLISLIIMTAVLASTLMGCVLLTKDGERQNQQVIAEIKPISFTYEQNGQTVNWQSEKKEITRLDLVLQLNANYSSWYEQNQGTLEQAAEYFLQQLISKELYLIHYENFERQGLVSIRMGENGGAANDLNIINKSLYKSIDTQLLTNLNEIREKNGEEPLVSFASEEESGSGQATTFPIYTAPKSIRQQEEESIAEDEFEIWTPSPSRAPAMSDYAMQEAFKKLYNTIAQNAIDHPKATEAQKQEFRDELKEWDELAARPETIGEVYFLLASSKILNFVMIKDLIDSTKISKIDQYFRTSTTVSDEEVQELYNTRLNEQILKYESYDSYVTDITGDEVTILHHPNSDYFFVRHILIGFTDEQKARLNEYNADSNRTAQQKKEFREQLAAEIVAYPHKNGENDLSKPMTAQQVYNEVRSIINPLAGNSLEAERAFQQLIYKYNSDPGIFSSAKGYAVGPKPADVSQESYVIEFATAARELKAQYDTDMVIGTISELVLTDHGYHILFLSSVPRPRSNVLLRDYTTTLRIDTVYDVLWKEILDQKAQAFSENWSQLNITNYLKANFEKVVYYEKAYEDIK